MFSSLNRLSILAAALASLPCAAHAAPPNVVLIISDDQAWTDYGFMGHPHVQTPRLDRLASESLTFTRGYVPSSLCRPSLATIITGLYAHQHRLVGNDPAPTDGAGTDVANLAQRDPALRAEMIAHIDHVPTLPKLLAEQGYVSFQSGKWWEGNYRRGGFTEGMTRGFPAPGGRHGDDGLAIGREGLQVVLDFIHRATRDNKPFFVWYAPMLPHAPHTPPARLVQKYQPLSNSLPIARYWATCQWFDETCGQLLDFLDQHELRQNTLVLYVTDNGWINQPDSANFAPRSKRSPYDGGVRTPIMIRWPGHVPPRREEIQLASSIDLAPTILRACGLQPTPQMPGIDLLNAAQVQQRDRIFGEIFEHDVVDIQRPVASLRYRWIIAGDWKLIVPFQPRVPDAPTELFDVKADAFEQQDLANQQQNRVETMHSQLDQWWDARD